MITSKAIIPEDFTLLSISTAGSAYNSYSSPAFRPTYNLLFVHDIGSGTMYSKYIIVTPGTRLYLKSGGTNRTVNVYVKITDKTNSDSLPTMTSTNWTHFDCDGGATKMIEFFNTNTYLITLDLGSTGIGPSCGRFGNLTKI